MELKHIATSDVVAIVYEQLNLKSKSPIKAIR